MTSHTIAACGPGLWAAPRRRCRTRIEALLPASAGGRAELHVAAPTRALTHRARGQRRSCGALAVSPVVAIVAPVIERGDSSTDLMNHLLQNRIIFVGRVITDVVAQQICSALMALELDDPTKDIKMYINAGGGQQYSIMAVIDMMNQVKCDIQTVAFGNVASTATLVLANGTKGKRFSLKNARIMVNQPLGGVQGSFVDVRIQAAEQSRNIKIAREILHLTSGRSLDECGELLDREYFMSPDEAQQFGIIDGVL